MMQARIMKWGTADCVKDFSFLCLVLCFYCNFCVLLFSLTQLNQEGAAVEGPPAMGSSLQLSTCMLFWGFLGLFVPAVEGFRGWAIECCQLHFPPTDPRCHGNEIWDKMGYNSACVREI